MLKKSKWKLYLILLQIFLTNKVGGYRCRSQVPEHEILKIVRMYEPIITEFFDNEEEMAKSTMAPRIIRLNDTVSYHNYGA
jgi:hypothetical protein